MDDHTPLNTAGARVVMFCPLQTGLGRRGICKKLEQGEAVAKARSW
ncbi:MAG: hypothetical protein ACLT0Y_00110 [Christensenellales bacterium]